MAITFEFIVKDNEKAAKAALDREDWLQAFLLIHMLLESLMRIFLKISGSSNFNDTIKEYKKFLDRESPGITSFVDELTQINRRRNRIVHNLWQKGYTFTNQQVKEAAFAAVGIYGLFIEFLQTYDDNLGDKGFQYHEES